MKDDLHKLVLGKVGGNLVGGCLGCHECWVVVCEDLVKAVLAKADENRFLKSVLGMFDENYFVKLLEFHLVDKSHKGDSYDEEPDRDRCNLVVHKGLAHR